MYKIIKVLKTKQKELFVTDSPEELKKECERLDLREFQKPYIYTHVYCEDINGKPYALKQFFKLGNGQLIIVSPDKIANLFNL